MTLKDAWRALLFQTEVRLYADAPPAAVQDRLADLVAPSFTRSRQLRRRPFRGRLTPAWNVLRWKQSPTTATIRQLSFSLTAGANGQAILSGRLVVQPIPRYVFLTWLFLNLCSLIVRLIFKIYHHESFSQIARSPLMFLIAITPGYAYFRWVGFFFRKRDTELVQALRTILASDAGAVIMRSYLAPGDEGVVDLPPDGLENKV